MPFIPVPDTAHLILQYTNGGQNMTNGFYFEKAGGWDAAAFETLIDDVYDAWAEGLQEAINTATYLTQIKLVDLSAADGITNVNPITTGNQGTAAGDPLPRNICMSVTLGTGAAGRSRRGRVYHVGAVDEWLLDEGNFDPESRALVDAQYGVFFGAIETASGADHVIVSRQQGNVVLAEGVTYPVTSVQARVPIATQRKRI